MMAGQVLLGVSLFTLLLLDAHGAPVKGTKGQHQSSSDTDAGGNVASHRRAAPGYTAPVSYNAPAGYYSTGAYMPGHVASSQQAGVAQSSVPEAKWSKAPQAFEESPTNVQGASVILPPLPPPGPVLQSGETSNVVREAELGNYQDQTEEFGYPAYPTGPGQPLPPVALPSHGVGGLWGDQPPYPLPYPYPPPYPFPYPYPVFDYSLLYGLYPPGTYTTFSRDHEKGKDYYQTTHYLKDHGSDGPQTPQNPGTGQQKVYPSTS
ncbi:leucine-rich repeat extensin-like protein 5 isoform X8 [Fundulus heteroclitus]|uniref:leucine-rich repeat extensin-like protein 5 isoform X8 n=1 Tax=Fundulus heteroclitus TaxID=8078 RepID=UPI00165CCFA7|nr:leucine-rich repeat extensin-like protein 5 isoform X8 [Fundulus heteroclitus]